MGLFQVHAPSAKFTATGQRIGGVITDARQVQTVDFKTKRPEYWENKTKSFSPYAPDGTPNEPKAQLEVTVDTGVPDANGETERRLFIKNKRQFDALKTALRQSRAGRRGLLIGGSLWMTLTGTEATPDGQDANTWAIEYQPPADGAPFGDIDDAVHLFGGGTWRRGQSTPAPVAAVASQPSPAPTPSPQASATQEALGRMARAHESSPRFRDQAANDDQSPPF